MKIVFLIDQLFLKGGIERMLSIKANYWVKKGLDVTIITSEQNNKTPCFHIESSVQQIDLGINYLRNLSYFHVKNLIKVPKHWNKLNKALKNIKPDLVIVCSHSLDTYMLPFIQSKVPKIKEFHFSRFIEKNSRKGNSLKRFKFNITDFIESKYDQLVVLNKDEKAYLSGSKNVTIIPNTLTLPFQEISSLKNKKAIAIGRLAPVKNYEGLISIWAKVTKEEPEWILEIFGEGDPSYKDILKNLISKYNLNDKVFLKGNSDDVGRHLKEASLFIMTSHNECFPLVLLEAQSFGIPIISYDSPHGPRNILTPNSGILVGLYEENIMVDAIIDLIKHYDKRKCFSEYALKNIQQYQLEKVMSKWSSLFKKLTN